MRQSTEPTRLLCLCVETSNTSPNGTGASCVAHTAGITRSEATLKQLSACPAEWRCRSRPDSGRRPVVVSQANLHWYGSLQACPTPPRPTAAGLRRTTPYRSARSFQWLAASVRPFCSSVPVDGDDQCGGVLCPPRAMPMPTWWSPTPCARKSGRYRRSSKAFLQRSLAGAAPTVPPWTWAVGT